MQSMRVLMVLLLVLGVAAPQAQAQVCGMQTYPGTNVPVFDESGINPNNGQPCILDGNRTQPTCAKFLEKCGPDGMGLPENEDDSEETPTEPEDPEAEPPRELDPEKEGFYTDGTPVGNEGLEPYDGYNEEVEEARNGKRIVAGVTLTFDYLADMASVCLPCSFVQSLVNVMYDLGDAVTGVFAIAARTLLGVMFVIYILYQIGKLLFPFGPLDNVRKTYGMITSHIGITMICALLLSSFVNYWNVIFIPPVTAGMDYTGSMIKVAREEMNARVDDNIITQALNPAVGVCTFNKVEPTTTDQTTPIVSALDLGNATRCLMEDMQATLGLGVSTAMEAMMGAVNGNIFLSLTSAVIAFVSGVVLLIVYGPAYLSFPIKVVDVIMRWALLCVLSPFFIMFFAVPLTRYIAITSLRGMLQSIMELVMMGLVIALGGFVIIAIADGVDPQNSAVTINSVLFWRFFFAGVIINLMLSKAKTFASAITYPRPNPKGMDVDVASGAAQNLEGALNKAGGGVNSSAVKSAGKGANAVASKAASAPGAMINKVLGG